jgi:REP element-mobilizing transposase RayT
MEGLVPFWRLYYHLVWATKNREPLIQHGLEDRLYAYLVLKAAELGVYVYAVNGWEDHVHLIVAIPPSLALAGVVKRLKGASSHELNLPLGLESAFAWQRGYGALSLGERQRPDAEAYVRNQKAHHSQQSANAWLERYAEFDEGPTQAGLTPSPGPAAVQEPGES